MTVTGRGDSRRRCCNVEDRFGVWDIRTLQALPLQVFAVVSRNLTTSAPHHQELENLLAGLPRIFLHRAEILVAIGLAVEFFEAAATWNFHFGRPASKQFYRQHRACRQNIFGAGLRAVDQLVRRGLVREHQAKGPHGGTYTVLTATPRGAQVAQRAARDAGHDAGQQTWTGLVKPAELAHDTTVYRAARHEQGHIEAAGGRVTRVRIDAELKQVVARATETARAAGGRRAADEARRTAAQALELPVQEARVQYPDAQLELEDREGQSGRVNVEVASEHYHAAAIAAKASAGFAMHGSSGRALRNIARAIDSSGGSSGGAAQPGRDGSVEL